MALHGELAVGLLEVVVGGALVDTQDLVVVEPHGCCSRPSSALRCFGVPVLFVIAGGSPSFTRSRRCGCGLLVREVWRYGSERAGEEGEKRGSEKRLERGGGKRRLEMGVGASGRCKRVRALSRAARSSHVRTRAPAGFFLRKGKMY